MPNTAIFAQSGAARKRGGIGRRREALQDAVIIDPGQLFLNASHRVPAPYSCYHRRMRSVVQPGRL